MKLRPVTFFYKSKYENGPRNLQYGLIAEEVAQVYPELVAWDTSGKPYSVRYQYIATMLLNEVKKQYHRAQEQAELIRSQEQKITELEQRLSRLEGLVTTQVSQVEGKPAHGNALEPEANKSSKVGNANGYPSGLTAVEERLVNEPQ